MRNFKKIIILLIILLIIMIICLVITKNKLKKDSILLDDVPDISADFIKELGLVEDYSTFFSIEKMIKNFIASIQNGEDEKTYNLLSDSYIQENNILQGNVLEKTLKITKNDSEIIIREIYENKNAENGVYYIKGILEKEEQFFILYTDQNNSTYCIEPINEGAYNTLIADSSQELENRTIEENSDNSYLYVELTEEELVTRYFENFIENSLYYPEYAYELLDEEYKNKCFSSYQEFETYIGTKRESFETNNLKNIKQFEDFETVEEYREYISNLERLKLDKYQIRMFDGYDRYICIDTEGNYYTFKVTSPFKYTLFLGDYAIPTEDFAEKYKTSSETAKVILNIKRFFMGIDDKNYGYSYSVLSEGFRNNYFANKEDFISYAKQNFFEKNKIEYLSYEQEKGLNIHKIKLTDETGINQEERVFNMIVKLNDNAEFEMSFSKE